MGWFRRAKKEDAPDTTPTVDPDDDKRLQDVYNTRQEDLRAIDEELVQKHESLKSVMERLESVKKEYDVATSELMARKKELVVCKKDLENLGVERENLLKEIASSKDELAENETDERLAAVREEVETQRSKVDELKRQADELHLTLESRKTEQRHTEDGLLQATEELTSTREEIQTATKQLEELREEARNLQHAEQASVGAPAESTSIQERNVLEAASAVVASMTRKMQASEEELSKVREMLKNEQEAHDLTRKQLEALNTHAADDQKSA